MKNFNPDRELNKIKYGKRNKVVLLCFLMIVVSLISYSFALYQVRHNKRIIYTTVDDFKNNKDIILSVLIDGEESKNNEFPIKGTGYYFDSIECDNKSKADFDYLNWSIILNANKKDKCTIKFTKKDNVPLNEYILSNSDLINDETKDKNYRYIGENPNNYIWFNCDSYDGLTKENAQDETHDCEKWRIIGIMNNITIIDELTQKEKNKESLVKIIRAESIGNMAWNTAETGNWADASLQKLLNGTYYNGGKLGNAKGITNESQAKIENILWNIGGHNGYTFSTLMFYIIERGTIHYGSYPVTWPGHIALMYGSDYGYATSGSDAGEDRDTCLTIPLDQWNTGSCYKNDWLNLGINEWAIGAMTDYGGAAARGPVINRFAGNWAKDNTRGVRPSLFLKSNIKITSGDGSENNPYIMIP